MTAATRLAVVGAAGRMGRAVIAAALDDARFEIVAAHSREGAGQDVATLVGRPPIGVVTRDALAPVVQAADAVIEFTRPAFSVELARLCAEHGCALVSGTTGFDSAQHAALQSAAGQVPLFWAPNMSVGVNLLLAALRQVASRLGDDYDAEIIESHHRHKVDAPSGTAIALGEVLAETRGQPLDALADHGRAGRTGERAPGRIGIHSVRGGEIVGEHDVRLIGADEELRLGHTAFRRGAFATGALRAAAWLVRQEPGLYGMHELLALDGGSHMDTRRAPQ